ncbi:MAG: adenylosuccinate lyase, partial [Chloroflexi bacterium]|nr:adenylosuccinate lyase [Chloroflexota bacterium]
SRLLRGFAQTALENVALWHERDISHSSAERVVLPDACLALDYMLATFTHVLEGLRVYPERMQQNLEASRGLVFSQRVLLALIEKGLSRQDAYKLVQRNALRAWDGGADFLALLKEDSEVRSRLKEQELEALFDYRPFLKYVDATFQRLGLI